MDAIVKTKRRKRYERHPTGKRVAPLAYTPAIFRALHQHGPLTTTYLYRFVQTELGASAPSLSQFKHHLGDLYHETNTPQGDAYLGRPVDQNRQAKHLEEIHENDAAAEEYLKAHGVIPHAFAESKNTNHPHRFMASCITASIELACREAGLTFVSGQELLAKSPTGSLKLPADFSFKGTRYSIPIVPDGYFAIRYQDGSYRAFLVEADRGTEPIERSDMENQRSYLRKILQYQSLLTRPNRDTPPPYRKLLGIQSGLVVLNCTNNYRHMESMMAVLMRETQQRGSTFMLFKPLPVFADKFAVPLVLTELFTPWRRAGHPELDISKP
jgi:hypothetical protein